MTNTRENTLAAIRYGHPRSVPIFDGTVWDAAMLGGNFRSESWTDAWGVVWKQELPGMVPTDVVHPLADLSIVDRYRWPDPQALTWTAADQARFDAIDRSRMLRGGCHVYLLNERLCALMGMENYLVAMYEDPDRLQVVIDRVVEYTAACFRRLMDLGVDSLHMSEDLGTQRDLMMSPEMFRRFLLPAYERMFAEARHRGVLIDFHSCGAVEKIVPDLMAVGVNILNPLQVRANDRRRVKAMVRGRMAVLGGIDSYVVHRGTFEEIRHEVCEAFDVWKPGGGWLAAPDQVLTGAPEDNIRVFWDVCRNLADY